MKKIFLLLGLAVVFSTIFYVLLVSSPHPMGSLRFLILILFGAGGLVTLCEAMYRTIEGARKASEMSLNARLQKRRMFS